MAGDTVRMNTCAFYKSACPAENNQKFPAGDISMSLMKVFGRKVGNALHGVDAITGSTLSNGNIFFTL
jgi:hypothetical protein